MGLNIGEVIVDKGWEAIAYELTNIDLSKQPMEGLNLAVDVYVTENVWFKLGRDVANVSNVIKRSNVL